MDWCVCRDVEIVLGCCGEQRLGHGAGNIDLLVSVPTFIYGELCLVTERVGSSIQEAEMSIP